MSTLILLLPPRVRLHAQGRATPGTEAALRADPGREYDYVLSQDGLTVQSQGRLPAALLPRADQVVLMPAESDLSWHRVTLPRAGRDRLRAALAGAMEEQLLEDTDALHFAVEPEATAGEPAWVAVGNRAWLAGHLGQLEQAQVFVDRLAPLSWPQSPPQGHFYVAAEGQAGAEPSLGLHWCQAEGVSSLRLDGSLARDMFPSILVQSARWTGAPQVVAAAERWLGTAVGVQDEAQRAVAALTGPWNLRQFDLAPHARGLRAVRQLMRGLMHPSWRPVRIGLVGLLLVQLLGLNVWAWQQRQQLETRREALDKLLSSTYPQVRAILDAPVQMRRETELLRAQAGRAGEQDLENLLAAAATAWPADRGPVDALSFETGRLLISANGWSEAQIQQFRRQLDSEGWQLELNDGRMSLARARAH